MSMFANEEGLAQTGPVVPHHPHCFIAHWHPTRHFLIPIRGWDVPVAIPKRQYEWDCRLSGSLHLTQYSNAIPAGFIPLNACSYAIARSKQFLPKTSCCENTTLMGSNTALTWPEKHGTTEAHTKDDHCAISLHWQHRTVQKKPRTKCCATWIWPGHAVWP